MRRTGHLFTGCLLLAGLLLVSACAISPQRVSLALTPAVPDLVFGNNSPVQIVVMDERTEASFGSRGGVYPDTSLILPAHDLIPTVAAPLSRALRQLGFVVVEDEPTGAQLRVSIENIQYQPNPGPLVTRVRVSATLRAEIRTEEVSESRRYHSRVSHRVPVTPSAQTNQRFLNQVLERSLTRLLQDQTLLTLLVREN